MVWPNPVGALILTQRHNKGHASIDSVCQKCKQAWIYYSATDSDLLDLVSVEKTQTNHWYDNDQYIKINVVFFLHPFYCVFFMNYFQLFLKFDSLYSEIFSFIWTEFNSLILHRIIIAFLMSKHITCFVMDIIIKSLLSL